MTVYLPTAAIGNGHMLATLGGAGEIMSIFYPHIDFAQNVYEALPFIYIGEPYHGRLIWAYERDFASTQSYLPDTNILRTELRCSEPQLQLTLTDFVPASTSDGTDTALVRIATIRNLAAAEFTGAFGHYFDFRLGEVIGKQAVRYERKTGRFLQYFRDIAVVVGGTEPDAIRCGKAGYDDHSAKSDIADGHLNGQVEDIGAVDFAQLFHLELAPGETRHIAIIISFGPDLYAAEAALVRLQQTGTQQLHAATSDYWHAYLRQAAPLTVDDELHQAYRRALLMLAILQDARTGSFVAAPEFDPEYRYCGGYGYCWPRDASEAADALSQAGYPEALERLVKWYAHAQQPDGMWGQRHWAEGPIAASWSLRDNFRQLDQSAAALLTICQYALGADTSHKNRVTHNYLAIKAAANTLAAQLDEHGCHAPGCDLWETFQGVFAYTNAAFSVCLQAAAACAREAGDTAAAGEWLAAADKARRATLELFSGDHFARGLSADGKLDEVVDSATLGLIEPFPVLDLSDPQERRMALDNLTTIEDVLGQETPAGPAIRRYEGDAYLGGTVGCVNTLWAALVKLRLAQAFFADDPVLARQLAMSARSFIHTSLAHATPAGCLPELMAADDFPYWAAPHAWASALLVKSALAYQDWSEMDPEQERT
jgi:oligosaccharide amylase